MRHRGLIGQLLWTDHDPTGGLDEAEMLRGWLRGTEMGGAELHVISGAGHWPQWEAPEEFVAVHARFLGGEGA